jgi:hypothetical protein
MNPFVTANGKPVAAQLPCIVANHFPHLPILRRSVNL